MKKKEIHNLLVGMSLVGIYRSCNLVEFVFCKADSGDEGKTVYIHTLSSFSLWNPTSVLLGSDDLYISSFPDNESVDLAKKNVCIFDEIVKDMELGSQSVTSAQINHYGDLIIKFETMNIVFFCDNTVKNEKWRIFEGEGKHLVCYGNKLVEE